MKPLLIGEAPSKNEVTERPLEGRIGKRLAACCNLTLEDFLRYFDRVNLLHVRQDSKEKGFEFDAKAAAAEACRLRKEWPSGRTVILLGRRVAEAFGVPQTPYFERRIHDHDFYVVPHPSGLNRWYNDPTNMINMNEFMTGLVMKTRIH